MDLQMGCMVCEDHTLGDMTPKGQGMGGMVQLGQGGMVLRDQLAWVQCFHHSFESVSQLEIERDEDHKRRRASSHKSVWWTETRKNTGSWPVGGSTRCDMNHVNMTQRAEWMVSALHLPDSDAYCSPAPLTTGMRFRATIEHVDTFIRR